MTFMWVSWASLGREGEVLKCHLGRCAVQQKPRKPWSWWKIILSENSRIIVGLYMLGWPAEKRGLKFISCPSCATYWVGQNFHSGFHKIAWKNLKKFFGKTNISAPKVMLSCTPSTQDWLHEPTLPYTICGNQWEWKREGLFTNHSEFQDTKQSIRLPSLSATSGFCKPNSLFHSMCFYEFSMSQVLGQKMNKK